MYVVLSPDEELMNLPVGYSQPDAYKTWLECGLQAFEKKQVLAMQNLK
jgi:hypothetical protein